MEERESIERLGGELVVFFNAAPELVESWSASAAGIGAEVAVVADPRATLYEGLGTVRHSTPLGLVRGSLGPVIKSASQGRLPKLTSADMLRLGADVAVRADGEIAELHRASTPDDRVTMSELAASLE